MRRLRRSLRDLGSPKNADASFASPHPSRAVAPGARSVPVVGILCPDRDPGFSVG